MGVLAVSASAYFNPPCVAKKWQQLRGIGGAQMKFGSVEGKVNAESSGPGDRRCRLYHNRGNNRPGLFQTKFFFRLRELGAQCNHFGRFGFVDHVTV
jgi:hypothetical protein